MIVPIRKKLLDFMCFEEAVLEYPKYGVVLITGKQLDSQVESSNGSGKTALVSDSLLWCLWGQATKFRSQTGTSFAGSTVDDVIRYGQDSCQVTEVIEIGGEEFEITRHRKLNGRSTLKITKDGKQVEQSVDELLGMSESSFLQTNLFGQASRRFTSYTDSERKKVLDDLLHLGALTKALTDVRQRKTELILEENKAEAALSKTTALAAQAEQAAKEAKRTYSKEVLAYQARKEVIAAKRTGLKKRLQAEKKHIAKLDAELELERKAIEELDQEGIAEDWAAARDRLQSLQKKKFAVETEIIKLKVEHGEWSERLRLGQCPTCEKDLVGPKETKLVELKLDELLVKQRELTDSRDTLTTLIDECAAFESDLNARIDALNQHRQYAKEHEAQRSEAVRRAKDLHKQIGEVAGLYKTGKPSRAAYDSWVSKFKAYSDELDELKKQRDTICQKTAVVELLEEAFGNGGVRSLILDNVIPVLNETVAEYVNILFGSKLTATFDTERTTKGGDVRDKFDISVVSPAGIGYHKLSGGQRARLDFCISMALQSLQTRKFNMLVLDEPFEGVDPLGVELLVELLEHISLTRSIPIFVVAHNSELKSMFSEAIEISMQGGISCVKN